MKPASVARLPHLFPGRSMGNLCYYAVDCYFIRIHVHYGLSFSAREIEPTGPPSHSLEFRGSMHSTVLKPVAPVFGSRSHLLQPCRADSERLVTVVRQPPPTSHAPVGNADATALQIWMLPLVRFPMATLVPPSYFVASSRRPEGRVM